MMDTLTLEKINDVYLKVNCDAGIAMELSEYFTFSVPGARHMPAFRNKLWDGKIRLFNAASRYIYFGLKLYVEKFARERDYQIEYANSHDFSDEEFSIVDATNFIKDLTTLEMEPRDYQVQAFAHAVRNHRALLLSPTASGKSLIIYLLSEYCRQKGHKVLIVVPTTSLVHQMSSDFVSYGCSDDDIHRIFSGQEKMSETPFVITTWQSIYKQQKKWFEQFSAVIGDEAHLFKAKSLTSIMSKLILCPIKVGFTGTLDGTNTNKLVLEGLFGPVKKVTTTAELIEQKHLADFRIKAILLKYPDDIKQQQKNNTYRDEMQFLVSNPARNNFLTNLALSLKGNTLLLFQYVEKHGELLYKAIEASKGNRKVFFVHGNVEGEERNEIRQIVEEETDAIIVASFGTFSTGVNIKNLHNVIFASPSKSRVRNLQSIGRGLRKGDSKTSAVLYDIADDLSWKSWKNHTLNHFVERIKMYNEEKFENKIYMVKLKG